MSTENMGKSIELLERRMKQLGMCETQDVKRFGEVHQQVIEGVKSLSAFECEDDIDALKSNVNKVRDMGAEEDEPSCQSDSRTSTERNSPRIAERSNCDRDKHDADHDSVQNSVDNDANCSLSSGDTLLCSGDDKLDKWSNCDEADGADGHNSDGDFNGSCSESSTVRNGEDVEAGGRLATNIRAGLVMSPISLTQDMPLTVGGGGNNNRFSKVLENIPQPLLYIPTTKQLVAGQSGQCSSSKAGTVLPQKHPRDGPGPASPEDFCNGSDMGSCNGDPDMLESNRYFSPESHQQDLSLGHGDSFGSKDMDQITLNSVEGLLPHIHSADSFHKVSTDASSLSSISTGTDFSVSAMSLGEDYLGAESKSVSLETEDMGFMEVNLHARNSYERAHNSLQDIAGEDKDAKGKRKGLGGLFSRGLFFRKPKEIQPGWKLFGKVPPKSAPEKDPAQISQEFQAKHRTPHPGPSGSMPPKGKKQDIEVMSTTALILENRPMNLPSKSPEETEKHRQEYEAMVEAAKKKEQRELKQKKKQLQMQRKHEDKLVAAAKVWNSEILPNWETMRHSKKARELWWQGLPPNIRGRVWQLAIGNDLNITQELYEICVSRAEERIKLTQLESKETPEKSENSVKPQSSAPASCKEASVKVIKLDVARTYPQLCIFQKGGPYYDLLHRILGAYACYRPDVGYVQGMSFLAAVLLLNMEVADAFICFANLLNRPCQVAFFRMDEGAMAAYFKTFQEFFRENLPTLEEHFAGINITPDLYLIDWIFLIFSKSLPFDVACRVWDVFCRDEEEFLFRTALGILRMHEKVLLQLDFIHVAQFLTKLPEDIQADDLFRNIDAIHMNIDKRRFNQVLASHKEPRES